MTKLKIFHYANKMGQRTVYLSQKISSTALNRNQVVESAKVKRNNNYLLCEKKVEKSFFQRTSWKYKRYVNQQFQRLAKHY